MSYLEEQDDMEPLPVYTDQEPPSSIFTTVRYSEAMMYWEANHSLPGVPNVGLRTRFYMLKYHIDRLRKAAECFNWPKDALNDEHVLARSMVDIASTKTFQACEDDIKRLHLVAGRVRVTVDSTGEAKIECAIVPLNSMDHEETYFPRSLQLHEPFPPPIYQLYLCPFPTEPSAYTRHKTDRREMYTAARMACGLSAQPTSDPVEVLLWNPRGLLMEGSLTSVYFYRPDQQREATWITPHTQCGGNDGTTRRWALQQGLCVEGNISVEGENDDGEDGVTEGELCWISNGFRGFLLAQVRKCYYDRAVQERRNVKTNQNTAIMVPACTRV